MHNAYTMCAQTVCTLNDSILLTFEGERISFSMAASNPLRTYVVPKITFRYTSNPLFEASPNNGKYIRHLLQAHVL